MPSVSRDGDKSAVRLAHKHRLIVVYIQHGEKYFCLTLSAVDVVSGLRQGVCGYVSIDSYSFLINQILLNNYLDDEGKGVLVFSVKRFTSCLNDTGGRMNFDEFVWVKNGIAEVVTHGRVCDSHNKNIHLLGGVLEDTRRVSVFAEDQRL